jgi:asparagine synthase (glutamine-hydrolysing)
VCGIVGTLGWIPEGAQRQAALSALEHRGPDQEGQEAFGDGWFGHRRLAVIDPSPRGRQPLGSARALLAYNGEIYGFEELRRELEARYTFTTGTDTEVCSGAMSNSGWTDCFPESTGCLLSRCGTIATAN